LEETSRWRGKDGAFKPGDSLGRYIVLETLGSGGMGVVYAAYDPELDRKIAVKLLHPEASSSSRGADARVRLLREAQAMARLSHTNVITVHDVGTLGSEVFIAMEYVEGCTLKR
jgi:serine/threonine protein kinase